PLGDVVVEGDRLVEIGHLVDIEDGGERLLLRDLEAPVRANEGRLDEVSWTVELLAAAKDGSAFLPDPIDRGDHRAYGLAVDQRTHQRSLVERIADADLRACLLEPLREASRDALLQDETPRGRAALARRPESSEEDRPQRQVEVRVVEDDDRVVP